MKAVGHWIWHRLEGTLTNDGTVGTADLTAEGGSYAADFDDNESAAYAFGERSDNLVQSQDMLSSNGAFCILFKMPSSQSETIHHVSAGGQVVADVDSAGNILRSYTYGPGIDNILAMTTYSATGTNTYYYLKDHVNTVLA